MSSRFLTRRFRLTIAVAVGSLVALEAGLHVAGFRSPQFEKPIVAWDREHDPLLETKDYLFQRDVKALWSPRPGAMLPLPSLRSLGAGSGASSGASAASDAPEVECVNAAGYRGPVVSVQRPQGVLRILTLGDSAVFGTGVRYEDTFSAKLAAMLRAIDVKAEVIDGGVAGYTARQALERYRSLGRAYKPKIVILGVSGQNDSKPAIGLADDDKIALNIERSSGLSGLKRRIRPHVRTMQFFSWLRHRHAIDEVLAASESEEREAESDARDAGSLDWNGHRRVSPRECAMYVSQLFREASADGARFILVAMPHEREAGEKRPVLEPYGRALSSTAVEEDLQFLDAQDRFGVRSRLEGGEEKLFLDEWNLTPFGHELIAQWLFPLVREQSRNRGSDPTSWMR
jgi:lysophospholipase L1-like esterase